MGRTITGVAPAGGIILSSAYKDWGTQAWKVSSSWGNVMGTSRWVTLKVMKDDPYFDIDWNLSIDHNRSGFHHYYLVRHSHCYKYGYYHLN